MATERNAERQVKFTFRILLPVLLAVIATFVIVGALINYSANRSDEQVLERQSALVDHILKEQSSLVRQQQADVVGWNDAVAAVAGHVDADWLYDNIGLALFQSAGHDLTFVLDPSLEPVLAVKEGDRVDPALYRHYRTQFEPLAKRLRDIDWQGALAAYIGGASHVVPSVGDLVLLDGKPAIVSFMPIAAEDAASSYAPGSEFISVTAQYLDATLAQGISAQLLLDNARFSTGDTPHRGELSLGIANQSGRQIATFIWTPIRPGATVLSQSTPAIIAALCVVSLIVVGLIAGLSRSAAELEAGREAAQHMAFHDKLTGLANRALFEDRLTQAVASARRGPNRIALMVLDLDRFKQVNDSLGHEAGDELICEVAERLRPLLRDTDTIARLGGDEFAIIQTDVKTVGDVTLVADRIIRAIAEPFSVSSSQAFVGTSIGIALAPTNADNAIDLTRKADIALYEAKGGGRNQFKIFEDSMSEAVQKRQTVEAELRLALDTGAGLRVDFAPLIRDETGSLVGVSAEIGWTHPDLGEVEPSRFLSVAEGCGLVEQLGDFTLRHACELGATQPGLRVSVPAYLGQLRNPMFFSRVFFLLEETGMRPEDLELEIGESMLSETETVSRTTLRKLRQAGITIALGDFGNGFRSLKLLQKFQVDRIKIDSGFIAQLADSPDPEAITHAVVWLARAIGVEVSADGVDTTEQKNFLSRMGVMSFQGALFSPGGQAAWLRDAARIERNAAPRIPPRDDVELWG